MGNKGSPYQTERPATEKARFCLAVRANGTEESVDLLVYWGSAAEARKMSLSETQQGPPDQSNDPVGYCLRQGPVVHIQHIAGERRTRSRRPNQKPPSCEVIRRSCLNVIQNPVITEQSPL